MQEQASSYYREAWAALQRVLLNWFCLGLAAWAVHLYAGY